MEPLIYLCYLLLILLQIMLQNLCTKAQVEVNIQRSGLDVVIKLKKGIIAKKHSSSLHLFLPSFLCFEEGLPSFLELNTDA